MSFELLAWGTIAVVLAAQKWVERTKAINIEKTDTVLLPRVGERVTLRFLIEQAKKDREAIEKLTKEFDELKLREDRERKSEVLSDVLHRISNQSIEDTKIAKKLISDFEEEESE